MPFIVCCCFLFWVLCFIYFIYFFLLYIHLFIHLFICYYHYVVFSECTEIHTHVKRILNVHNKQYNEFFVEQKYAYLQHDYVIIPDNCVMVHTPSISPRMYWFDLLSTLHLQHVDMYKSHFCKYLTVCYRR